MTTVKVYSLEQTRTGKAKVHRMRLPSGMNVYQATRVVCGARASSAGWVETDDNCTLPMCKKCFHNS